MLKFFALFLLATGCPVGYAMFRYLERVDQHHGRVLSAQDRRVAILFSCVMGWVMLPLGLVTWWVYAKEGNLLW